MNLKVRILSELKEFEKHGGKLHINVEEKLVDPIKEKYYETENSCFELITVFSEGEEGYRIAYDEEDDMFCMGYKSKNAKLQYYGHYGDFIDTFTAL